MATSSSSASEENSSSRRLGFLSTLVGEGSECHGYKIRVVGHSLGGAVATVLGMMHCMQRQIFFSPYNQLNEGRAWRIGGVSPLCAGGRGFELASLQSRGKCCLENPLPQTPHSVGALALGRAIPSERRFPHQDSLCDTETDLRDLHNGFVGYNGSNPSIDDHSSYQGLHIDQDVRIIPLDDPDCGLEEHRTSYREISVEPPDMFCNWCHYAMQKILDAQMSKSCTNSDSRVQHLV